MKLCPLLCSLLVPKVSIFAILGMNGDEGLYRSGISSGPLVLVARHAIFCTFLCSTGVKCTAAADSVLTFLVAT